MRHAIRRRYGRGLGPAQPPTRSGDRAYAVEQSASRGWGVIDTRSGKWVVLGMTEKKARTTAYDLNHGGRL